jgi:hypothetical protein
MKQVIDTKPWIDQIDGKFYLHVNSFAIELESIQEIANCCSPQSIAMLAANQTEEPEERIVPRPLAKASVRSVSAQLKARAADRKARGICLWCDRNVAPGKSICQRHVNKKRAAAKRRAK